MQIYSIILPYEQVDFEITCKDRFFPNTTIRKAIPPPSPPDFQHKKKRKENEDSYLDEAVKSCLLLASTPWL